MRIVLVVEGIHDKQLLESFFHGEIVTTNGSDIPDTTISYLLQLGTDNNTQVIIMTDPDGPGLKIRNILNDRIPNVQNVHIPKNKAIRGKKVGIAETRIEDLKEALNNILPNYHHNVIKTIDTKTLQTLGLTGKDYSKSLRKLLCERLKLPESNSKTLIKMLNSIKIDKIQLEQIVRELRNGL